MSEGSSPRQTALPIRPILAVTLAVLLGLSGGPAAAETAGIPLHEAPRPVPEIAFADEAGTPMTLAAFHGKVVVLNLWATWCVPCRQEMPTLDRLQEHLGGDRFAVVALSIDRGGVGVVRKFFDEIGIQHLPILIDTSGRAVRELNALGLPTTLLIDAAGRELGRRPGAAEWDTPGMIAFFQQVIATQPQGGGS
jgi:thiol-disulfide isomerase/thioredoxin